jgi:hypothetical protein
VSTASAWDTNTNVCARIPIVQGPVTLPVLIFGVVLIANIGIKGVVQSQEGLANRLARPDHRLQNSNRYGTDDRTDRALGSGLFRLSGKSCLWNIPHCLNVRTPPLEQPE